MLKVYKCGSKAKTVSGDIPVQVTGIKIHFDRVMFEISYFHSGEHKCIWIEECEIIFEKNSNRIQIGFKDARSI